MGTNGAVAVRGADVDDKRSAALLKAIGLDKVPPEQRELAIAIADRYGLDLMLKHLVIVDGRPYITRDGLLHVAHTSGAFDGIEVTEPTIIEVGPAKFWTARCSVYRKDMSRPFTYTGRYPTSGGNQRFAPEMAVKVSEVMALRRAFDVSAPVIEERWDMETAATADTAAEPPRSLKETIAAAKAAVTREPDTTPAPPSPVEPSAEGDIVEAEATEVVVSFREDHVGDKPIQCPDFNDEHGRCRKATGHDGPHRNGDGAWPR